MPCTARIFLSSEQIRVTEPDAAKPYARKAQDGLRASDIIDGRYGTARGLSPTTHSAWGGRQLLVTLCAQATTVFCIWSTSTSDCTDISA